MTISDEMLSAFLDAELSPEEMEQVREAIANDEKVADRLAELAKVDLLVNAAVNKAAEQPIRGDITNLLTENETDSSPKTNDNLVSLSAARTFRKKWAIPVSMAASVAFVAILSMFQFQSGNDAALPQWQTIASTLEQNATGESAKTEHVMVNPQLTFIDKSSRYCRQASVAYAQQAAVFVACRNEQNEWQLEAYEWQQNIQSNDSEYVTASNINRLDNKIDELISGMPLNRSEEAMIIRQQWQQDK